MPWLPDYGQGLQGWGAPPHLDAAPIAGLAASIWAMRNREQENLQNSLQGAIQEFHRQKVANALTEQYAKEGLIPQELSGIGDQGAAEHYIRAQQYRTTPTDIGDGTNLNLTDPERLRLAIHNNAIRARMGSSGGGGTGGASGTDVQEFTRTDPVTGLVYIPAARGRWQLGPQWMQKNKAATSGKPGKAAPGSDEELYNKWGLYPEDFSGNLERVAVRQGVTVPDPQGTHMRIKGGVLMPFEEFMKYARAKRPQTGADKAENLAQDYGQPQDQVAKSREEAQPGQSYYAPDGTIRTRQN